MRKQLVMAFVYLLFAAGRVFAQGHSDPFPVCTVEGNKIIIQAAYNPVDDEFLVVWEDGRKGGSDDDLYGQIISGDGTLLGDEIGVCTSAGHQWWPRLDFDPVLKQYLVVFEDWRSQTDGNIRGVFVKADGTIGTAPDSEQDGSFLICNNPGNIYTVSVAFNYTDRLYLVVWGDFRNDPTRSSYTGADVFGQLVAADGTLLPPPDPADPAENVAIAADPTMFESVADVSYSHLTNEWFVVYGTSTGYVMGQRVNAEGKLVLPDGTLLAKPASPAMLLSGQFSNGPDCLQSRVQFNSTWNAHITHGDPPDNAWCEAMVVWKGRLEPRPDNDIYGQRVGFFYNGSQWEARYIRPDGTVVDEVCNHSISVQDGWPNPPEVCFSVQDNEWLTAWGDNRNATSDIYGQRLAVDMSDQSMSRLADDRVTAVSETENIVFQNEELFEGYVPGIAHSSRGNHFLVAYERQGDAGYLNVYGFLVHGSEPSGVADSGTAPPSAFRAAANYPNPFNPETAVEFSLPQRDYVTADIYDIQGRKICRILDAVKPAGFHTLVWDGRDTSGQAVPSGIYICRLQRPGEFVTVRMTLAR